MVGNSRKPNPSCFAKVNLREAAESADDSDDLNDFIADFGEQCGIGSTGRTRERGDETCVSAIIPTPVRVISCQENLDMKDLETIRAFNSEFFSVTYCFH